MRRYSIIAAAAMVIIAAGSAGAQKPWDLKHFPAGSTPLEIGTRVTEHYLETPHSDWGNTRSNNPTRLITYPDVCAWLGAMWFTTATGNDALYDRLVERFEPLFSTRADLLPNMRPKDHNVVDFYVFGAVPLEIYRRVPERRYLDLGLKYADGQWTMPENPNAEERKWQDRGYSWQTRLWIDDMFMITALQAVAWLATGERAYIDRASREMVLYLDEIQRPNGLFYHAPSVPVFWGRGDGWMAVGMTEMLRLMPRDDPNRARIAAAYAKMMATLLRYQGADGMWHQVIDDPHSYVETSSSAMFAYAFITGVKNGWLDRKLYGAAARRAWLSLLTYLDENWELRNVCEGTGIRNDYQYYLDRRRRTGDLHGQAPLLWCAYALVGDAGGGGRQSRRGR